MPNPLYKVLDFYHVQLVEELLALHSLVVERVERQGEELICLCPFHNDTNPSLRVHRDTGVFRCLACLKTGSIVDLIAKLLNMSTSEMWGKLKSKPVYDVEKLRERVAAGLNEYTRENQSYRYLSVLNSVSNRMGQKLRELGLEVSEQYRQHSLSSKMFDSSLPGFEDYVDLVYGNSDLKPSLYQAVILFDTFSGDMDRIVDHFHFYRPPRWDASFTTVLKFYQQFVVWHEEISLRVHLLFGE
jgi:hypothetical protein